MISGDVSNTAPSGNISEVEQVCGAKPKGSIRLLVE